MTHGLTRRIFLGAAPALIGVRPALAAPKRILTLAGTGAQGAASDGEAVATAKLNQPYGVETGPDGSIYWADFGSNRVMRLDRRAAKVFVVAGTGEKGHAGDGGAAKTAVLSAPHVVRFVSKAGVISTLVGTGSPGFGGDGGPSDKAQLNQPHSIVLDRRDNLFICDIKNDRIRKRDASTGVLTTFAGDGTTADTPDDAPLTAALNGPRSIDIGPDGTMYLILREGNKVYALDPKAGRLRHLAGTGAKGYAGDGGPARTALWNGPKGIAYAPDGSLYIADTENHVIRRVSLRDGTVITVAGTGARG